MKGTRSDKILEMVYGESYLALDEEGRMEFFKTLPKDVCWAVHSEAVRELGVGPYSLIVTDQNYGRELTFVIKKTSCLTLEDVRKAVVDNIEEASFIEPLLLGGGANGTKIQSITEELCQGLTERHKGSEYNLFGRDGVNFRFIPGGRREVDSLDEKTLVKLPRCVFGTVTDLFNVLFTCAINYTITIVSKILPLKGELVSVTPDDEGGKSPGASLNSNKVDEGVTKQDLNVKFAVMADVPDTFKLTWDQHRVLMNHYYGLLAELTEFVYCEMYLFIEDIVKTWEHKEDIILHTENIEDASELTYEEASEEDMGLRVHFIVCSFSEEIKKLDLFNAGDLCTKYQSDKAIEHLYKVKKIIVEALSGKFKSLVTTMFGCEDPFCVGAEY